MSLPVVLVVWDCNVPGMAQGMTRTAGLLASTDNTKLYMVKNEVIDPHSVSEDFSINWDRVVTANYQDNGSPVTRPDTEGA